MEISLSIPDGVRKAIESGTGVPIDELLSEVIETRIKNLFKRYGPKKPVGRPAFSQQLKRAKHLSKSLLATFANIKTVCPHDFDAVYGPLEAKLKEAISSGDLETLEWFDATKPWLSTKGDPAD